MMYTKHECTRSDKVKESLMAACKDPRGAMESAVFGAKLKIRSLNNPMFAKKVEDIFLPSNVVIMSLLALSSYMFIFGPGANPSMSTILWFIVLSAWSLVVMELIRRNVGDPSQHNGISIRVSVVGLIIPLMLMQTIGIPPLMTYIVITFLVMSPVLYAIRSHWKISGHMCTYTSMATILTMITSWAAPLFLLIPVLSWSRMKLKAHDAKQVFAGTLVGFVMPYVFALMIPMA